MASLIDIGLSGIKASQARLNITGNNVTNANTPGYSRQRAEQVQANSQYIGVGYLGSGANIAQISRQTDQFAINQVRVDTSQAKENEKFLSYISQIDSLLADPTTGLTPAMNSFFAALQSAGDDPSSIPERQLVLAEADSMINRYEVLLSRLDTISDSVDQDMRSQVTQLNAIAEGIADLNQAITNASGQAQGSDPNDLLDQRDELLRQLSEIVDVNAIENSDGSVDILMGKGQALVVSNSANEVVIVASDEDPSRLELALIESGSPNNVTSEITGGELGALLSFRDSVLADSYNSIGRVALVMADTINEQHRLGMDLEGDLGGDFFLDINSPGIQLRRVIPNEQNAFPKDRVVGVEITDTSQLTTQEYTLTYTGPSLNDIVITDASTGDFITQFTLPGVYPAEIEFNGLKVNLTSGSFQVGDEFLITPTRDGARELGLNTVRVEDIALASPIRTDADSGNTGNAVISQGEMLAVNSLSTDALLPTWSTPGQLTPPILIRFISDNYYQVLDNTDPANPVSLNPPLDNQLYIPGVSNDIFTSDEGQTAISAGMRNVGGVMTPVVGTDVGQIIVGAPGTNGYGAQNLTFQTRDPDTGLVTGTESVTTAANSTAQTIAAQLSSVNGVSASAFSEVRMTNFVDDGGGVNPSLTIIVEDTDPFGAIIQTPIALGTSYDPNDIADFINSDPVLQDHNYIAWSDGTTLTIRNLTGEDVIVTLTGDATDTVDIESDFTAAPTTMVGGNTVTVGGRVEVRLDNGVRMAADNSDVFEQVPLPVSSFIGYQVSLAGTPEQGDRFTIEYNEGGVSDNRNALELIGLETTGLIDGSTSTYNEAYSQLVETVGSSTNQAQLDDESSTALLRQSEQRLQEIAGVNLDEEAGRLIQFEAAYNASAQVVSVARDLFNTLLSTFG